MLKFVMNDQLITVFAKHDCTMIVNSTSKKENSRKILISSHHIANIVLIGRAPKGKPSMKLNLPESGVMTVKKMIQ